MVFVKKSQRNRNFKFIFIASPVVVSYVTLWRRIFKIEGGYFKYIDTVNVDFIDSELPDEKNSHRKSSNNDSWK